MSRKSLQIDLVSDVVCPWCIIGYKRLEHAIELVKDEIDVDLHWHPFELNPNMPIGGENLREHLAAKYGTTLEGSIKARANLTQIGAELGFTFDYFDEMKMFNTFKAHQAIRFAREQGKETDMILRLFSAFFGERKEIDQIEVIVQEAESIGLNSDDCRSALETSLFSIDVRTEQEEWLSMGISSVPTYVFNRKTGVSGAYESNALAEIMLDSVASH